jgi:hypothetical protein
MSFESLECEVCFLRFDNEGRRPIDLGCGHCFCQECTANHPDSFSVCPDCRVASLHPHTSFALLRILAEVERYLEAQKEALPSKVWDSWRTHPDIRIMNNLLTIRKELNPTNYAVATISCPLTGSGVLVAAQIIKYDDNSHSKVS